MPFNRPDAQKVPITVGGIYTPCNTCSLDPPDSVSQTAFRSVHPFLHSSLQRVPILYNVRWNAINEQLKRSSAVAEMGDRLVTIDMARKEGAVPLSVGGAGSPSKRGVAWAEAYLYTKCHLDPSNRLATIHQCHRQTVQDRQRSDTIGWTVLQTVAQKIIVWQPYTSN